MTLLKGLLVEALAEGEEKFRPCAFFDERLDCIRVITRDCSVLEERISPRVTVLLDNYFPSRGDKQYVGFTIKGARHFCLQHQLPIGSPIKLTALLDALTKSSPEVVVQLFVDHVAKPLVREEELETVEIPGSFQPA